MTTYILRTGSEVTVPAAPMVAQVQAGGLPFGHRWSARGTTAQPPVIERPDRIVLPSITEPVTLRILPVETEPRFGPQSVLTVVIRHDRAGEDSDQVVLDDVDLSGLTHRDLVQLIPDGRQLRIVGLRSAADTPLPPVAEIARDAAREILGLPQVDADRAVELSARIDGSSSMLPALGDGSVTAACDVLAGMATVISPGRQLSASVAGLTERRLCSAPPERFGAEVTAALSDSGEAAAGVASGTGFRTGTAPAGRTVLISSGIPADWPGDRTPDGLHLLVLGSPGRSTDWPGAGEAVVVDRGRLICEPPDREAIAAAVRALLHDQGDGGGQADGPHQADGAHQAEGER